MFSSIITDSTQLTFAQSAICIVSSLVLGMVIAVAYMIRNHYTKGFVMTVAILPLIVQVVILMVNGNLGVGVAVMGAFSLVRFRSMPGSAKEICTIFMSMAIGLATGTGYITFAVLVTAVMAIVLILFNVTKFGSSDRSQTHLLKVTIPEQLNIDDAFDDVFNKYLSSSSLEKMKTTNMGSLFEITYNIKFKDEKTQKVFIDDLRTKNGNLPIVCTRTETEYSDLL